MRSGIQIVADPNVICQACAKAPATCRVEQASEVSCYLLCSACTDRLERRALRPREWYNLAAIHGWSQYELFDDFYEQDGVASAPDSAFPVPLEPRALRLDEVEHDLDRLVGHCRTRWHLGSAEYDALARFNTTDLLARVIALAESRVPDPFSTDLALLIAANVLKESAQDFVRAQYHAKHRTIYAWSEAAAACLPRQEGLTKAISELELLAPNQMYAALLALGKFRSPDVLVWIEQRVPSKNVGDRWGMLASQSRLTWEVASLWLARGRPLSLVALDAISAFVPRTPSDTAVEARRPRFADNPSVDEMRAALERYLAMDDTPKAHRLCGYIIKNLHVLRVTRE